MLTQYGLAAPVASAFILIRLRYTQPIYDCKSICGFDPLHSWLGAFIVTISIEHAKATCRAPRPGYLVANLYCGASIGLLCTMRSLFKPIYGAGIDTACRMIYRIITGQHCYRLRGVSHTVQGCVVTSAVSGDTAMSRLLHQQSKSTGCEW